MYRVLFMTALIMILIHAPGAECKDRFFFYHISPAFTLSSSSATVYSVPEYVRDVPKYDADGGTYFRPIENGILKNAPSSVAFYGETGMGYSLKKFDVSIGGRLEYIILEKGRVRETKYYVDDNNSRTASTYYGFLNEAKDHIFIPGIFVRLGKQSRKISWFRYAPFLESSLAYYNLYLENGWDRNNTFYTRDRYKLAGIYEVSIVGGIRIFPLKQDNSLVEMRLFTGIGFPLHKDTSLGRDSGLKTHSAWILGITIGIGNMHHL